MLWVAPGELRLGWCGFLWEHVWAQPVLNPLANQTELVIVNAEPTWKRRVNYYYYYVYFFFGIQSNWVN